LLTVGLLLTAIGAFVFIQSEFPITTPELSPSPFVSATLNPTPTPSPTILLSPTPSLTALPTPSITIQPTSSPSPTSTPNQVNREASNWAGYTAATDLQTPQHNVTSVSGSWTVPAVAPSLNDTFSAVWIGVGGQFDKTLIQCGTEQDSIGGRLRYSAWYEVLPQNAVTIRSFPVSAGDQIQASIQLTNDTQNEWTLTIFNLNSGHQFQKTFNYASSRSSAEWIIERPNVNNAVSDLANFGNATLTNCQASIASISGGIGDFPYFKITMYSSIAPNTNPVRLTDVSDLSGNGTTFTVSYLIYG
jgi:hypothetical protein